MRERKAAGGGGGLGRLDPVDGRLISGAPDGRRAQGERAGSAVGTGSVGAPVARLSRLALALVVALAWSALAVAPGVGAASTIAGAPTVVFGQQEFGNTTSGNYFAHYEGGPADFWNLALRAGDHVTVDWEAAEKRYAEEMAVFPVSTSDYSLGNATYLAHFVNGNNNKEQSEFSVGQAGNYPMMFLGSYNEGGGPFAFTAFVHHVVVLGAPVIRGFAHGRTGTVSVAVRGPDGSPLTDGALAVTLHVSGGGVRFARTATPVEGRVSYALRLPRSAGHRIVRVSASAEGADYLKAASPARQLTVR